MLWYDCQNVFMASPFPCFEGSNAASCGFSGTLKTLWLQYWWSRFSTPLAGCQGGWNGCWVMRWNQVTPLRGWMENSHLGPEKLWIFCCKVGMPLWHHPQVPRFSENWSHGRLKPPESMTGWQNERRQGHKMMCLNLHIFGGSAIQIGKW